MQTEQDLKENLEQDLQDQERDINEDRSDTTSFVDDSDAVLQILALNQENARLSNTVRNLELTVEALRTQLATAQENLAASQAQIQQIAPLRADLQEERRKREAAELQLQQSQKDLQELKRTTLPKQTRAKLLAAGR